MNTIKTNASFLDFAAACIIIIPLICFFGIVGIGGMIDQRKMSKEYHEKLAQSKLTTVAQASQK